MSKHVDRRDSEGEFIKVDNNWYNRSELENFVVFIIVVVAPVTLFNVAAGGSIIVLLQAFSIILAPPALAFIVWDYCCRGELHYFMMLAIMCLLIITGILSGRGLDTYITF